MPDDDFDLRALYDALDDGRRQRQMTWAEVAHSVNRSTGRGISISTLTGLKLVSSAEGDGILQVLLWLGRAPESFMPGLNTDGFRLAAPPTGRVLRWDTRALFDAIDRRRRERGLTWTALAREVGGFTPGMLTHLSKGGRVGFPGVMRLTRWLDRPAADFIRTVDA